MEQWTTRVDQGTTGDQETTTLAMVEQKSTMTEPDEQGTTTELKTTTVEPTEPGTTDREPGELRDTPLGHDRPGMDSLHGHKYADRKYTQGRPAWQNRWVRPQWPWQGVRKWTAPLLGELQ